jgi:hypothetical protein
LTLRNARFVIFPNNALGPAAPPPPSPKEQIAIRRKAAQEALSLIPQIVARTFFAMDDEEEMLETFEEEILDLFEDSNMNKHLIYSILELVVVRLVPELAEATPTELLRERGVDLGEY